MVLVKRKRKVPQNDTDRELGLWISYQLRRAGISQQQVAAGLHVSREAVSMTAYGRLGSRRIRNGIANALNFRNWEELIQAFQREGDVA